MGRGCRRAFTVSDLGEIWERGGVTYSKYGISLVANSTEGEFENGSRRKLSSMRNALLGQKIYKFKICNGL